MSTPANGPLPAVQSAPTTRTVGKASGSLPPPTRDLNEVVHGVLVVGLVVSAVLMLVGLGLDLLLNRTMPTEVLRPGEALRRAVVLRPSGFFSLGLIVLMLTPLFRVIGSVVVFVWERDWRYAGVTFLVLIVMLVSLWVGQG
jgi:uncharacterized membrane protein